MSEVGEALDDGRVRTGTVWTGTAHVVTAVIGSGVLALPWSMAQMGWLLGPIGLLFFAYVTYYTSILLVDGYRSPGPVEGKRNYSYSEVVRSFLGRRDVIACAIQQHCVNWGTMLGYTITATMSMMAIKANHCHHQEGADKKCEVSGFLFPMVFGLVEGVLSQFPSLEKITVLSYIAAAMSFFYSFVGLFLCLVSLIKNGGKFGGSLFGERIGGYDGGALVRVWDSFQALGNIAFAFTYSSVLIEIQDTIRSPPAENKTMKRATKYGLGATTVFYIALSVTGFAAFGDSSPGNLLTGFYKPLWLLDIANLAVIIHLVGAYQVFAQPIFASYEEWLAKRWPNVDFFTTIYTIPMPFCKVAYKATPCKLILRTAMVVATTVIAAVIPFFNAVVGLIGAMSFWPLTVYYPVSIHVVQAKVKRWSPKWVGLQLINIICLFLTILAIVGSAVDIVQRLKEANIFHH